MSPTRKQASMDWNPRHRHNTCSGQTMAACVLFATAVPAKFGCVFQVTKLLSGCTRRQVHLETRYTFRCCQENGFYHRWKLNHAQNGTCTCPAQVLVTPFLSTVHLSTRHSVSPSRSRAAAASDLSVHIQAGSGSRTRSKNSRLKIKSSQIRGQPQGA